MKNDGSDVIDPLEVKKLISEFAPIVPLWNITAGVPRLAAHVGRPYDRGAFNAPPPDEHPLIGIERLIRITGELQRAFPGLSFVGTGYSWLRQYFPNVGAGILEKKMAKRRDIGHVIADLVDAGCINDFHRRIIILISAGRAAWRPARCGRAVRGAMPPDRSI